VPSVFAETQTQLFKPEEVMRLC